MTATNQALLLLLLPLTLSACDMGTYTPSAHSHADASTGSRLSGTDTGVSQDGSTDPSLRNVQSATGGGH